MTALVLNSLHNLLVHLVFSVTTSIKKLKWLLSKQYSVGDVAKILAKFQNHFYMYIQRNIPTYVVPFLTGAF